MKTAANLCLLVNMLATLTVSVEIVNQLPTNEEGVIDVQLKTNREDGRHEHVQSFFELRRIQKESGSHPELKQSGTDADNKPEYVDALMAMMWDWHHVMAVRLHNATSDMHLIPTTGQSDMVLMHNKCDKCWSMHGSKWQPDEHLPPNGGINATLSKKHIEYFFMEHLYDVEVEGFYWTVHSCLRAFEVACAKNLVVYAIQIAKPWFHTLGDGYFGLATSYGYQGNQDTTLLHQIYDHGMIKHKIFGVHTHMFNTTEDPTQIRFGAFNKDLFMEGHELLLTETRSKHSWEIKFNSAGFFSEETWKGWHALIDPGYPFIALPKQAFEAFKRDLMSAYPDEPVTCADEEWCYFMRPCSKISKKMPDLKFTFPTHKDSVTYRIPSKSFLFSDVDPRTELKTCHLGIVQQRFSDTDHFVLGSSFMENFYVVYDASDPNKNRIGLSYNVKQAVADKSNSLAITMIVIASIVFCALIAVAAYFIIKCRKARNSKKNSFSVLSPAEGSNEEQESSGKGAKAETSMMNPNDFLNSTAGSSRGQFTEQNLSI